MRRHQEHRDQANRLSALQMFLAFLSSVRVGRPVGRTRRRKDKEAISTQNENLENPGRAGLVGDDHHDVATGCWAGFKRKVRKLFRRKSHSHRESDELRKSSMANEGPETDVDAAGVSTNPEDIIRESRQERDRASPRCTVSTPALTSIQQNHMLGAHNDRDWCQLRDLPRGVTECHLLSPPTPPISRPKNPALRVHGDQNLCQLPRDVTECHLLSPPTPPISRPQNPVLRVHGDRDRCQLRETGCHLLSTPTPLISRPRNPPLEVLGDQDLCELRGVLTSDVVNDPKDKGQDRVSGAASYLEEEMDHDTACYPLTYIIDGNPKGKHEPELCCDTGEKVLDDQYCSRATSHPSNEPEDLPIGRPPTTDPQATRHPPTICKLTPALRSQMKECLYDIRTPGLEYSYSWEDKLISGDEIEYVMECDVPVFLPAGISTPDETGREYFKDDVKYLGSGSFGSAYLAKMNGQSVVIKLFKFGWTPLEEIVREAQMMSHVEGKKCSPKFFGLVLLEWSDAFMTCGMVMEYIGDRMVEDSNLFEVFRKDWKAFYEHKDMVIPRREWLSIAYRLTLDVKKIHEMKVIVNDIKINNVLLRREGSQWMPYIIDLGLSVMKSAAYFRMPGERQSHNAPELFTGDSNSTEKSDIFALGYILGGLSNAFNLGLKDVVGRCMDADPKRRPTADVLSKILRERMRRVSSLNCGLRPQF